MVPRPLGRTGLSVAPVALGTVKLGRATGVKYPRPFELPSDREVDALLDAALRLGVTLYDTAPAYGDSERRLAPFVKRHRDRIVLATKAGERYDDGRSTHDFSGAALAASLETSLARLGTDRVDLLLLHSDGRDVEILTKGDAVETLLKLKKQGKVRAVGISAKSAEGIDEAARRLDVVMAPYSMADPSLGGALDRAHRAGMGVLAIKGLNSGKLEAKAGEALRFVTGAPFIDALVIGTLSIEHLGAAVRAAEAAA